jgi:hypothetical protein
MGCDYRRLGGTARDQCYERVRFEADTVLRLCGSTDSTGITPDRAACSVVVVDS